MNFNTFLRDNEHMDAVYVLDQNLKIEDVHA